jgi:hypothetical protein
MRRLGAEALDESGRRRIDRRSDPEAQHGEVILRDTGIEERVNRFHVRGSVLSPGSVSTALKICAPARHRPVTRDRAGRRAGRSGRFHGVDSGTGPCESRRNPRIFAPRHAEDRRGAGVAVGGSRGSRRLGGPTCAAYDLLARGCQCGWPRTRFRAALIGGTWRTSLNDRRMSACTGVAHSDREPFVVARC